MQKKRLGFSLVEVSIVLLVVALLIGGIMTGRSLIRSSELQATMQEYSKYVQVVSTFRDKYFALPGDFAGATTLWGTASGGCPEGAGTGTETCNGNGDGHVIDLGNMGGTYNEGLRAWQHLSNAGLIDGGFTGTAANKYEYLIGTSIPASKLGGAGWKMATITTRDIPTAPVTEISYTTGDIPPNLTLWLGGPYFEGTFRMSGVITPLEAYDLDAKSDDGRSTTGRIISQSDSGMSACDDGATGYATTGSTANSPTCVLVFKTGL